MDVVVVDIVETTKTDKNKNENVPAFQLIFKPKEKENYKSPARGCRKNE
jgi:hypothetical protein